MDCCLRQVCHELNHFNYKGILETLVTADSAHIFWKITYLLSTKATENYLQTVLGYLLKVCLYST